MKFINTGIVLKSIRKADNQTQAEYGQKYKLHSQYVSNAERGLCLYETGSMKKLIKDHPKFRSQILEALLKDEAVEYKKRFKL